MHYCLQKLIKVVTVHGEVNSKDSWKVYVLAEHSLQKWIVSSGQQDILIFESDISCLIRESFCTSIWVCSFLGMSVEK